MTAKIIWTFDAWPFAHHSTFESKCNLIRIVFKTYEACMFYLGLGCKFFLFLFNQCLFFSQVTYDWLAWPYNDSSHVHDLLLDIIKLLYVCLLNSVVVLLFFYSFCGSSLFPCCDLPLVFGQDVLWHSRSTCFQVNLDELVACSWRKMAQEVARAGMSLRVLAPSNHFNNFTGDQGWHFDKFRAVWTSLIRA